MVCGLSDRSYARARRFSVDQYGARSALTQPAAELRRMSAERIAKQIEEGLVRIPGIDSYCTAVEPEAISGHGNSPRLTIDSKSAGAGKLYILSKQLAADYADYTDGE